MVIPSLLPFVKRHEAEIRGKMAQKKEREGRAPAPEELRMKAQTGLKSLPRLLMGEPEKAMPEITEALGLSSQKLVPGRPLPHVILNTVQGGRVEVGAPTGRWQLIVVYRGKHDPVSKNYLASLQQVIFELDELGTEVVAVSADSRERAEAFLDSLKAITETKDVSFKIAYGLSLEDMYMWGLYVSAPRSPREADHPFPEPALFLLNPEGELHIIDYSNNPFSRPDLRILIEGIRYIDANDYPIRGTFGFEPESTAGYMSQKGGKAERYERA